MSTIACYGSGLTHSLFAAAFRRFHAPHRLVLLTNPRLPWGHERGADPGFLVVTPPLVAVLEELGLWDSLRPTAAPLHTVHYYGSRNDEQYGSFDLREIGTGRMSRLKGQLSARHRRFREGLGRGFWTVPVATLKKALEQDLRVAGVSQVAGELRALREEPERDAKGRRLVAEVQTATGPTTAVPLDRLVITQYHCPLPRALPGAADPEGPNRAPLRPARVVPRSKKWDFRLSTDMILDQPPDAEREWALFRSSSNCLLELWDKDATQIHNSIRRTTADPRGPVGVRVTTRNQVGAILENTLSREGWHHVSTLTQFVQPSDFANEALRCAWAYIHKTYEAVQNRLSMKHEFVRRGMDPETGRAREMLEKQPKADFAYADTHLSRDWIHNTALREPLPPCVVPICDANHSFLHNTFDLGLNYSLVEAFYAAKHWSENGPAAGLPHHQFSKAKALRTLLRKMDKYSYFKPWLIGKRMRIDFVHNRRLAKAISIIDGWRDSDRPLPVWRRAFLE